MISDPADDQQPIEAASLADAWLACLLAAYHWRWGTAPMPFRALRVSNSNLGFLAARYVRIAYSEMHPQRQLGSQFGRSQSGRHPRQMRLRVIAGPTWPPVGGIRCPPTLRFANRSLLSREATTCEAGQCGGSVLSD